MGPPLPILIMTIYQQKEVAQIGWEGKIVLHLVFGSIQTNPNTVWIHPNSTCPNPDHPTLHIFLCLQILWWKEIQTVEVFTDKVFSSLSQNWNLTVKRIIWAMPKTIVVVSFWEVWESTARVTPHSQLQTERPVLLVTHNIITTPAKPWIKSNIDMFIA